MDSIRTERSWRELQANYGRQKKRRTMAGRIRQIAGFLCLGVAAAALLWFWGANGIQSR